MKINFQATVFLIPKLKKVLRNIFLHFLNAKQQEQVEEFSETGREERASSCGKEKEGREGFLEEVAFEPGLISGWKWQAGS